MPDLLDQLPLEVLLAMQDALGDPTEEGRERARLRAVDAGFHVQFFGDGGIKAIPMEAAPEGVEGLEFKFGGKSN